MIKFSDYSCIGFVPVNLKFRHPLSSYSHIDFTKKDLGARKSRKDCSCH